MGILETLTSKLNRKAHDAVTIIADIAAREVSGKSAKEDADRLSQALQASGKTPAYYQEVRALFERRRTLAAQCEDLPVLEKKAGEFISQMRTHEFDTEAYLKQRESELHALRYRQAENGSKHKLARKAQGELHALEIENARLLNVESVDLDRYTLIAGGNILARPDPGTPYYEVSMEIWQQESKRRARILERANERLKKEHDTEVGRFEKSRYPTVMGGHAYKLDPPPPFSLPTWADVMERGWNRELDASE